MQIANTDLGQARDTALECIRAVDNAFDSVFSCTDETDFLQKITAVEEGLARAEETIAPLYAEFSRANQREGGPTCAGVTVENVPASSHALAVELARKLVHTVAPVRRLPGNALRDALLFLHRELLSVIPGENALHQLTQAKSILASEFDSLRSKVWTESSMAEVLRSAKGPVRSPSPDVPRTATATKTKKKSAGARAKKKTTKKRTKR